MAKITTTDIQNAAARVSSTVPTTTRGPASKQSAQATWERVRGRAARALAASPDVLYYYTFLTSNLASVAVREVVGILDDLLQAAEGLGVEQPAVSPPTATAQFTRRMTDGDVAVGAHKRDAIGARVDKYIEKTLVPAVRKGSRAQVQGDEARQAISAGTVKLLKAWKRMYLRLQRAALPYRFSAVVLTEHASEIAYENLRTTLEMEVPPEKLTAYTLQLAAARAAMLVLSREVNLQYRVRSAPEGTFPSDLTVDEQYVDGVLTSMTLSPSPKQLGIRSGDVVVWGPSSAVVASVGDTSIELQGSDIAATHTGPLVISPAAHAEVHTLRAGLSARLGALPAKDALESRLRQLYGTSAAEIRDLIVYLSQLYSELTVLSPEATQVLRRVGGEVDVRDAPALVVLDAYAPFFSRKLTETGDAILRELSREGFDRAGDMLRNGDVSAFLASNATDASKASFLSTMTRQTAAVGG